MEALVNATQDYAWGSRTAIPGILGIPATSSPVAELWMGAHPGAPSRVVTDDGPVPLDEYLRADPLGHLGEDVVARFGPALPYLLKIIAADRPLSLQVHPTIERARDGFDEEAAAGIAVTRPDRNYKDRNHKPELVYALTPFEAMCGFRSPRRAAQILAGLDAPLARTLHDILVSGPSDVAVEVAVRRLLDPEVRPSAAEVEAVADACRARFGAGSPSPRADGTVVLLADAYPGDPGVVTSLLLNRVTLQPGGALFVPAGAVHAYLCGVGVEIMASSDNVLRAGLTPKHLDIPEVLAVIDYAAKLPVLMAAEDAYDATQVFCPPVDDFELSVTTVDDDAEHVLPGRGARILLCLDGAVVVRAQTGRSQAMRRGESVFASAADGTLSVRGRGQVVHADVP